MTRRRPDKAEIMLWRAATRDVARLSAQEDEPVVIPVDEALPATPVIQLPPQQTRPLVSKTLPPLPSVFAETVEGRIRTGQAKIEARLDLHGMTEDAAYRALSGFVGECRAAGVRLALVITGKGPMGKGVLKQNLPRWFDTPPLRSAVQAIRPAFEKHGGDGAFYILFARRTKSSATSPR